MKSNSVNDISIIGVGGVGEEVLNILQKNPEYMNNNGITAYNSECGIKVDRDVMKSYNEWRTNNGNTSFSEWMKEHADEHASKTVDLDEITGHKTNFITTPSTDEAPPYLLDIINSGNDATNITAEKNTLKNHYREIAPSIKKGKTWITATVGGNSNLLPAFIYYTNKRGDIPESIGYINATTKVFAELLAAGKTPEEATIIVNDARLTETGPEDPNTPQGALSNEMGDLATKLIILGNVAKELTGDDDYITPDKIEIHENGITDFIKLHVDEPEKEHGKIVAYLGRENPEKYDMTPFAEYYDNTLHMAVGTIILPEELKLLNTIEGKNNGLIIMTENGPKKIAEGPGAGTIETANRLWQDYIHAINGKTMFTQCNQ